MFKSQSVKFKTDYKLEVKEVIKWAEALSIMH